MRACLLFAIAFATVALVACSSSTANGSSDLLSTTKNASKPTRVTLAQLHQIQMGMSQAQVEQILGVGEEIERVREGGAEILTYRWIYEDGSEATVVYIDDSVAMRASLGIRKQFPSPLQFQ